MVVFLSCRPFVVNTTFSTPTRPVENVLTAKVRINLPLFSTVFPSNSRLFLPCRPFVITTFSTGLVGVEVTSTPTRPVEDVLTTKGLQGRNNLLLDGRTVENNKVN